MGTEVGKRKVKSPICRIFESEEYVTQGILCLISMTKNDFRPKTKSEKRLKKTPGARTNKEYLMMEVTINDL